MTFATATHVHEMTGKLTSAAAGTPADADSDDALLARLSSGDEAAFSVLVDRYYGLLYRVAGRVLGDAAEAEDICQETFVKLWRDPHAIRNAAALKSWLAQVARNRAIDRLRQRRDMSDDGLARLSDPTASADADVRRREISHLVARALHGLPERQRTALQLTYFEALSNIETAEIMQVSVEAVESLLSRARRTLRDRLAEQWQDLMDELELLS